MSQSNAEKLRFWSVPLGIIVIAGLLITIVVLQVMPDDQPEAGADSPANVADVQTPDEMPDLSYIESRDPDDVQAAGPVDAPVGLVIYSDYQCPFCARWSAETLPEMMTFAERGDLRIEWRDVNMYGERSERAARAAHAAGRQDAFWAFHDLLFPDGDRLDADDLTEENMIALAEELALDVDQFTADMNAADVDTVIQQYAEDGRALGVSGTPTFIVAGEPIVGAQPTALFVDVIEHALQEDE